MKNLTICVKFISKVLGKSFFIIFLVAAAAAILESAGIILFVPTIIDNFFLDSGETITVSLYFFEFSGSVSFVLGVFIIALLSTIILKNIILYIALRYLSIKRGEFVFKMRMGILNFIALSKYEIIEKEGASFWINLIGEHSVKSLKCYIITVNCFVQLTLVIVYVVFAFSQSLLFGSVLGLLLVPVILTFKNLNSTVHVLSEKSVESQKKLSEVIDEICNSFRYLSAIKYLKKGINSTVSHLHTNSLLISNLASKYALIQTLKEPLSGTIAIVAMWISIVIFQDSITTILVSMFLLYRGLNSIVSFQANLQSLNEVYASLDIVKKYCEFKKPKNDLLSLKNEIDKLVISNLKFKYRKDDNEIIFQNLTAKKGEIILITGPSGVGKSTLLNLISGIIQPKSGSIKFLSKDNKSFCPSKVKIGYVPQSPAIFGGTIKENAMLFDKNVNDLSTNDKFIIDLNKMLNKIGLEQYSDEGNLNNNYNVGLNGYRLSGGQRQRLSFIRELLNDSSVLLLDEFTSAQDIKREKLMIECIKQKKDRSIIFIVSHKKSFISIADKVINLKNFDSK